MHPLKHIPVATSLSGAKPMNPTTLTANGPPQNGSVSKFCGPKMHSIFHYIEPFVGIFRITSRHSQNGGLEDDFPSCLWVAAKKSFGKKHESDLLLSLK